MIARSIREYAGALRLAVAARGHREEPRFVGLVTTTLALVVAYIAAALVIVPPDAVPEFHFVDERGAITVLSAIFLAMGSGFAFASYLISPSAAGRHRTFWLVISVAVGYLALDELLQFHERIGGRLDGNATLRAMIDSTVIRNWNDVIVISYGVLALPAAVYFLPSVLRFPKVLECLCVGSLFYVIHTAVDSVVEPPSTLSVVLEESAKLFCSTFLSIALLIGLLGAVRTITSPSSELQRDAPAPPN